MALSASVGVPILMTEEVLSAIWSGGISEIQEKECMTHGRTPVGPCSSASGPGCGRVERVGGGKPGGPGHEVVGQTWRRG